jgi:predicted PurR-regulated permease PerM
MNDILKFPLYAKLTAVLLGLIALIFVTLYWSGYFSAGDDVLLFAILLYPIVQFLKSKLFPHVLAVMLAVLLFVLFFIVLSFLSFQISDFAEDFDKIERNINIHIQNIQGLR